MRYIVYKIKNHLNKKIYIGCTSQPLERRFKQHLNQNRKKTYFTNAIRNYGASFFYIGILEELESEKEMFEREIHWISKYGSTNREVGYNTTNGGDRGPCLTGENHPLYGKPNPRTRLMGYAHRGRKLSAEHIEAIKRGNIGIVRSEETKNKIKNAIRNSVKRQNIPPEVGRKISAIKKGKRNFKNKLTLCVNNYKVYGSYQEAATATGVSVGNINMVVSGKTKHTKGFIFRRVTEEHLIF